MTDIFRCPMIFRSFSISILAISTLTLAYASAGDIELRDGMPFLDARKNMLNQHWAPVDVHLNDNYAFIGVEKKLRHQRFIEVESCAMDQALCIFNYKKNGQCIRLITNGENISQMRVTSWSQNCPQE